MADWSQLPKDLLDQIAKRLNSDIDILRFRSVCSTWRSIASYPPNRLPNRILLRPKTATGQPDSGCFFLSKHLILRLDFPGSSSGGWLVKLEQNFPGTSHLLNPLSESLIYPLPALFPKVLNLIDIQISELGQEFVLHYTNKRPFGYSGDVYKEKVIFSSNPFWSDEADFVIMTIHVSGKLAFFSFRDNVWTVIEDFPSPYDDVIHYKGQFYAVDGTGRAVVVDRSLTIKEIAVPVFGGDKKYLVELDGDLLLVDRYISTGGGDDGFQFNNSEEEIYFVNNDDIYAFNTTVHFKVFKLDQCGEKNWVEVKSLGDRVLFLGDNCSFSACASDLCGCKGNCIYFWEKPYQLSKEEDDEAFKFSSSIGVFDLENGSIGPLSSFPVYSRLFWPPPSWIMPTGS